MQKIFLSTTLLVAFHLLYAQGSNELAVPMTIQGDSLIHLRGCQIKLSRQGFPEQIRIFHNAATTDTTAAPDYLLTENIHFHFTRQSDGKDIRLTSGRLDFTRRDPDRIEWNATNVSDELQVEISAALTSDGRLAYKVKATALQDQDLKDITMHIPFQPGKEKAGLQYSLKPGAWDNEGKGGTVIGMKGKSMLVNNYSGPHAMRKGDSLHYDFNLVVTRVDQ